MNRINKYSSKRLKTSIFLNLRSKNFLIILIIIFSIIPIYPEDSSRQDYILLQYLETAAKNNPALLQAFAEYEAAMQKIPQAGSLPDPELTMGIFLEPMELVSGKQAADIRLMQMFPWFGTLKAAKDEMSFMAKAKYEAFRDTKLKLFYDVQTAWLTLYKIAQSIRVSEKNLQILKSIERISLVKFGVSGSDPSGFQSSTAGEMASGSDASSPSQGSMDRMGNNSPDTGQESINTSNSYMTSGNMGAAAGSGLTDLYRIQIEIKELENNIAMIRNEQKAETSRFNSFLNNPPQTPVSVPDVLVPDKLKADIASITGIMLDNNPMLLMLKYEEQSLESRSIMVRKMGYPMIGIGAGYSVINKSSMSSSSMNGDDMIMPMVAVTLPVYRKKYKAMQAEIKLLSDAKGKEYKARLNDIKTEYAMAVQLYDDSLLRMKLYAGQYDLSSKTLDIMLKSYASAGSNLTDILRVRQQVLDYELKQIQATADYNRSIAWLNRLIAYTN